MPVSRLPALAVVAGVVLSGCAGGGPGGSPSGGSTTPAGRPSSQGACHGSSPGTRVTLSEADNGGLVCLARTGMVELYLHGTPTDRWSPVGVTGPALHSVPSGKSALPIGVTAGFFAATGAGQAVLSSSRPPCAAADPQAPGCDGAHLVRIVVMVG